MVGRGHLERRVAHVAQHREEDPARVTLAADHVDVAGLVGVELPSGGAVGVGLADVELELGADHGCEPELGKATGDIACHDARGFLRRKAAGHCGVGEAPGRARLPRQIRQGREVGTGGDVGEPALHAALHCDDVTARRRVVDRAAEGDPVTHDAGQLVDEHVAPAIDADEVGIGHPDHIDPACAQLLDQTADVCVIHAVAPVSPVADPVVVRVQTFIADDRP